MPLTPAAEDPRSVRTVHDGGMFAEEFARKEPRSPEANRLLIEGLNLELVRPSFVSPRSSFLQVCSDVGLSACGWMEQRARIFEVTPPPVTRIPIAEWAVREDDGKGPPPSVPFVRRRMNVSDLV